MNIQTKEKLFTRTGHYIDGAFKGALPEELKKQIRNFHYSTLHRIQLEEVVREIVKTKIKMMMYMPFANECDKIIRKAGFRGKEQKLDECFKKWKQKDRKTKDSEETLKKILRKVEKLNQEE